MTRRFHALDIIVIECGGDNLAATFSPELVGDHLCNRRGAKRQDPRKGGLGITRSGLLVINKIDLAPRRRSRRDGSRHSHRSQ